MKVATWNVNSLTALSLIHISLVDGKDRIVLPFCWVKIPIVENVSSLILDF